MQGIPPTTSYDPRRVRALIELEALHMGRECKPIGAADIEGMTLIVYDCPHEPPVSDIRTVRWALYGPGDVEQPVASGYVPV